MKRFIRMGLLSAALLGSTLVFCQLPDHNPLVVEKYQLENGLTVFLNEDHSLPNVFGAVAVKGGSKRDPENATGIAHYFEHIMFKGTDRIGTLDYQSEKVYLDSIAALYDELALTENEDDQLVIQKKINRLSVTASQYAVPNEIEKILGEMGSTYVNAGTGNDMISYYDIFPDNQIDKWLEVYSHRFINPVYRLFQSELESVYEEYNMYKDDRFSNAFEEFSQAFYPDHPYGVPVLGYPEHLKNPSMSEMNNYFQTYYVANNMVLVLSGNFNSDAVKPVIAEKFGKWRSGEIPPMPGKYKVEPFEGRVEVVKRLTPVRAGILAFRSVAASHEEGPALDVISNLLANQSNTGLLNTLVNDHKLMMSFVAGARFTLYGGEYVIFMPKLIGQSLDKAEELVLNELNRLRTGDFSDELIEAVKTEIMVNRQKAFENQYRRGWMMVQAFNNNEDWEDVLNYSNEIKNVTKETVMKTAQKYYGDNYLAFYSKTGFPKNKKVKKPPFDPIPIQNAGKESEYAKMVKEIPVRETVPEYIEFGEGEQTDNYVRVTHPADLVTLFHVKNPVNDIFELEIKFGIGEKVNPLLLQLGEYMGLIGTTTDSFEAFKQKLQKLGTSLNIYSTKDYFVVDISGMDEHLQESLSLVSDLLYKPKPDDKKLPILYESVSFTAKSEKSDPGTLAQALLEYAWQGEKSPYLQRLSPKEVKNLTSDTLLKALDEVLRYEMFIHYSGKNTPDVVKNMIVSSLNTVKIMNQSLAPVKKTYKHYDKPTIYILHDKKPIQSNMYFYNSSIPVDRQDRPFLLAYNEYLDGGMNSVLFQEIRESRSFGYSTGGYFYDPFYPDENGYLLTYVGTQADKSPEAAEVMCSIINAVPNKKDDLEIVKKALIQKINSEKPTFRNLSEKVEKWITMGYTQDPRKEWTNKYVNLEFSDITRFYDKYLDGRKTVITIVGDKNKIDVEKLKKSGEIIWVSKDDIMK